MNNLTFTIHLKDYVTSVCKKISTAFENLQTEVNKTSSTTSKFQSVCERLKMPQLSAQLQVFGQIGEAFSSACETGINFGQAMADLSSITGIAGEELEQLSQSSRRIGAESGLGAATAVITPPNSGTDNRCSKHPKSIKDEHAEKTESPN